MWMCCCSLGDVVLQAHFACAGHMQDLNKLYQGPVVAVNLIDTKGDQLTLGTAYANAVARANAMGADVKYGLPCCGCGFAW